MPGKLTQAPEALFWYWVTERHRIYLRREKGLAKPWTKDVILRDYKFTNVFRQLDRGTVWLGQHLLKHHGDDGHDLIVFNVGWYRLFNWTGTGELLGWQTRWRPQTAVRKLRQAAKRGEQVFTGAHIVWGPKGQPKIDGVVENATELWAARKRIAAVAKFSRSLEATFDELTQVQGVGGFIAYEIVSDLRHTAVLWHARDINQWANVGPGALRGLRRLDPGMRPKDGLRLMRELLARSRSSTPDAVPDMELRDIEHVLCEFDKYCRVKFGEGRPRSKYPGAA